MEVYGASPEFGSSQNRYDGFRAIARALPTLFCIPPGGDGADVPAALRGNEDGRREGSRGEDIHDKITPLTGW